MIDGGRGEDDERFQGALNADDDDQDDQDQQLDAQGLGLDLNSILSGLMGGGQPGQAGGLDLSGLLGGLLGGMPDMNSMMGAAGTPFDDIVSSVASDLSAKTGLPKDLITMGAMFLISKLMMGGIGGSGQQGEQAGGIDLGALMGGILGGGLPGMDQGLSQQDAGDDDSQLQQGDQVLAKIGKQIDEGLNSQALTVSGMQQNGLASEFAEMSGLSEDEAAQSLGQIVDALKQSGLSQ